MEDFGNIKRFARISLNCEGRSRLMMDMLFRNLFSFGITFYVFILSVLL
jgi:hypothetical protein